MYFSASIFFKISTTLVYLYSNSANAFHVQYLNGYYVRLFDGPPASQHIHDLYLKLCEDIENFTRKNGASVATVIIQDLDYIIRKIDTTSVWSPGFDDELQKSNVRTAEKLEWDDEIKSRKIPNPDYQIKRLAVYGVKDISTPATLLDVFIYRLRRAKVILASLQNHSKSKIGSNTDSTTQVYTNLRENHKAIQILFRALTMSRTRRIYELYRNEFQKIVSEINNGNPDGIILPWLKAEQIWKERGTLDQDRLYLLESTAQDELYSKSLYFHVGYSKSKPRLYNDIMDDLRKLKTLASEACEKLAGAKNHRYDPAWFETTVRSTRKDMEGVWNRLITARMDTPRSGTEEDWHI